MVKRIIVGYDGSDTARKATVEAAEIARAMAAELHILNVLDAEATRHGLTFGERDELVETRARRVNHELVKGDLEAVFRDIPVKTEVLVGAASATIVDYCSSIDADLIVVGNRRVQGVQRLLGSVAIEVLRQARCSVYVAHTT